MKKERTDIESNFRSILLPIVYAYIVAAISLVGYGLYRPEEVIPSLEGYLALMGVLRGPALLAISDTSRLYSARQEAHIKHEPDRLQHLMETEVRTQQHENTMDSAERLHKIRYGDENE